MGEHFETELPVLHGANKIKFRALRATMGIH